MVHIFEMRKASYHSFLSSFKTYVVTILDFLGNRVTIPFSIIVLVETLIVFWDLMSKFAKKFVLLIYGRRQLIDSIVSRTVCVNVQLILIHISCIFIYVNIYKVEKVC